MQIVEPTILSTRNNMLDVLRINRLNRRCAPNRQVESFSILNGERINYHKSSRGSTYTIKALTSIFQQVKAAH